MSEVIVRDFPVFQKGVFRQFPALFNPYFRNTPDHLKRNYQKARRGLPKYEEMLRWQAISGPGFRGATHPGTGKVFNGVMTGSTHPVYNSDCLYINPARRVFAVADPPGITMFARGLVEQLDAYLRAEPDSSLEDLINRVNRGAGTGLRDRTTLAILELSPTEPGGRCERAMVLVAGDSDVYHGNTLTRTLVRMKADSNRWGTPNMHFEMREIEIRDADFFVLVTDGIMSVRPPGMAVSLADVIVEHVIADRDGFAENVVGACNAILTASEADRERTWFAGGDDLSVILVDPAQISAPDSHQSYILGGYIA